jgi:hypothetical protein
MTVRQADAQHIQNAFSTRLSEYGFNVYLIFVVDLLHKFELGVWKATLTHLLRVLYVQGDDRIQTLNLRKVVQGEYQQCIDMVYQVPKSSNIQSRHYQAVRKQCLWLEETCRLRFQRYTAGDVDFVVFLDIDYTHILLPVQCIMPVFEGLLPTPHNKIVLNLLFELALWHAFVKLCIHTEHTLDLFWASTKTLAASMHRFLKVTCETYYTRELPKETAARGRCTAALAVKGISVHAAKGKATSGQKRKKFNLVVYKYHALADYPETI